MSEKEILYVFAGINVGWFGCLAWMMAWEWLMSRYPARNRYFLDDDVALDMVAEACQQHTALPHPTDCVACFEAANGQFWRQLEQSIKVRHGQN